MANELNKHERLIELDDTQLFEMVSLKGKFVEEGRSLAREMEAAQDTIKRCTEQMGVLTKKVIQHKQAIFARLKKVTRGQLREWEMPVTTDIRDGKLIFIVSDALAEFQETFKNIDVFKEAMPIKGNLEGKK